MFSVCFDCNAARNRPWVNQSPGMTLIPWSQRSSSTWTFANVKPLLTPSRPVVGSTVPPTSFTKPYLVLVEGADDQAVVAALVEYESLDDFQIHDMKGKTKWSDKLRAIVSDVEFGRNVRALGLIRDADASPAGAWRSCKAAIESAGLVTPARPMQFGAGSPVTGISIVPSYGVSGAIEEVCLASFPADRVNCVRSYFECLDKNRHGSARESKAYVQAYLASAIPPRRDLQIAAKSGILDLSNASFDELRTFLRNLRGAE